MFATPLTAVIHAVLPSLLSLVPDDVMERGLDALFDVIEDAVRKSDSRIDDAIVLPVIDALRKKLKVPQEFDR